LFPVVNIIYLKCVVTPCFQYVALKTLDISQCSDTLEMWWDV